METFSGEKSAAKVSIRRSQLVMGSVFKVETMFRGLLMNLAPLVEPFDELLSTFDGKQKMQGRNTEGRVNTLATGQIIRILERVPAECISLDVINRVMREMSNDADLRLSLELITKRQTVWDLIVEYGFLEQKVRLSRFRKEMDELTALRNIAAHFQPLSDSDVRRAKKLSESILRKVRVKKGCSACHELDALVKFYHEALSVETEKARTIAEVYEKVAWKEEEIKLLREKIVRAKLYAGGLKRLRKRK